MVRDSIYFPKPILLFTNPMNFGNNRYTGYKGETETGSVDYYLADFRDGKTYINKEWVEVDLTPLSDATTVMITFDSTDKGQFGVNTPKYVFIDNLTIEQTK